MGKSVIAASYVVFIWTTELLLAASFFNTTKQEGALLECLYKHLHITSVLPSLHIGR